MRAQCTSLHTRYHSAAAMQLNCEKPQDLAARSVCVPSVAHAMHCSGEIARSAQPTEAVTTCSTARGPGKRSTFTVGCWLCSRVLASALKQRLLLVLQLGCVGGSARLDNPWEGLLQDDDVGHGCHC